MRMPSYRKHSSGQARVTLNGRDFLLGPYDSPESHVAYRKIIGEWLASSKSPAFREKSPTMAQVVLGYLSHAKEYYAQGTEYQNLVLACKPVSELYPELHPMPLVRSNSRPVGNGGSTIQPERETTSTNKPSGFCG